jgi:phosphoglycolate phosphatase-like HAD superfamily hydrolase
LLTSNLRIGAETKLKSVGLDRYFHVGGFGDDYGEKWDAALKGIREAEDRFGVKFENENIYIIGDSIYDIECAKRIEVVSIGVATGWAEYEMLKSEEPDYLYEDLSDWKKLIQRHMWK